MRKKLEQSNNGEFWIKKIARNKERDDEIDKQLSYLGWTVLRFWGRDILKNTDECVRVIEETLWQQKISDAGWIQWDE